MRQTRNGYYVRAGRLPSGLFELRTYGSDEHDDGTVVDGEFPDERHAMATHASERGLLRVEITERLLPTVPPLWFVHVDESRANPRATNLVAFPGDQFEPGTIISTYRFASLGVRNATQAGAVRWYPRDGLVHQLFVTPEWRRQFVGSTLLYTADAFHHANGWPGRLHGDGRRTKLGQLLAAGLRHPGRIRRLTDAMPSMDEPRDATS